MSEVSGGRGESLLFPPNSVLSLTCLFFVAALGLSLAAVSRGYSSLGCSSFSLQPPWLQSKGSGVHRLQCLQSQGSEVVARGLSCSKPHGLEASSSQTRDRTLVHCIGRQIPIHWTAKEIHCSPVRVFR